VIGEVPGPRPLAWSPHGSVIAYIDEFRTLIAQPVGGAEPWPLTPSGFAVADVSWVESP
jgi:hypothetical protein